METLAKPRRPIKESRRLRILITHRERMIDRRRSELDDLIAERVRLQEELVRVVKIEAAAVQP